LRKIKAGLIGAGFVGPLHVEAVRRLGYVDFVAVATSSEESAKRKAEQMGFERGYGDYKAMLADPSIDAVHICTPNNLHFEVIKAALEAGKHVICDKPLSVDAVESRELVELARKAGKVNAVTFNYRFNPLVQQARVMVTRGDLGQVRFVHGFYLQDWLLYETDFSWRLEPDKGGPSCAVGDIGSHWCDTAQFITGLRITRVLASLHTAVPIRKKPKGSREAFQTSGGEEQVEDYVVTSDDLGTVLVEFEGGAHGVFSVGQVCPGHKNDLQIEINGAKSSIKWLQERPNEMWLGHRDSANGQLLRDASLMDASVSRYANLPGGHNEGWADAFKNLMSNIYRSIAEGGDSIDYPTFEDGYRINCIVDAIVRSHQDRNIWVDVEY